MEAVTFVVINYVISFRDSKPIAKVVEQPVSQQVSRFHSK